MADFEKRDGKAKVKGNIAEGYAAVFGQKENISGHFLESIAPGAFDRRYWYRNDVVALFNHNWDRVLGRVSARTLNLEERPKGLWFRLELDERSPDGMAALATIDRGDVFGCSFGFSVLAEEWHDPGSGLPERIIQQVELYEISVCPVPAYPTTTVTLVQRENDDRSTTARRARQKAEAAMRLRGLL